ncbi:MAG: hypothetical protein ABII27_00725 [bacterium]
MHINKINLISFLLPAVISISQSLAFSYSTLAPPHLKETIVLENSRGTKQNREMSNGGIKIQFASFKIDAKYLENNIKGKLIVPNDLSEWYILSAMSKYDKDRDGYTVYVSLERNSDHKYSDPVFIIIVEDNYLSTVAKLEYVSFGQDFAADLTGKELGPQLVALLGSLLPKGTKIKNQVTNVKTIGMLLNDYEVREKNLYRLNDGYRVVDVLPAENEVSIEAVFRKTPNGKMIIKAGFGNIKISVLNPETYKYEEGVAALMTLVHSHNNGYKIYAFDWEYEKITNINTSVPVRIRLRRNILVEKHL